MADRPFRPATALVEAPCPICRYDNDDEAAECGRCLGRGVMLVERPARPPRGRPADDADFRIAALHVELAIVKASRGDAAAAVDAERWFELLQAGDYSFVPEDDDDEG